MNNKIPHHQKLLHLPALCTSLYALGYQNSPGFPNLQHVPHCKLIRIIYNPSRRNEFTQDSDSRILEVKEKLMCEKVICEFNRRYRNVLTAAGHMWQT